MIRKVKAFIEQHQMLEQGDRLVIGVSGGADSVCLLSVLVKLRTEYNLKLFAVHVNHGIRGEEAKRDMLFTEQLCRRFGVECRSISEDVPAAAKRDKIGEEEAGRLVRYAAFTQEAKQRQCTKIAVAHHMDDNAETVLFRMFRGTGLTGLAGIRPVTPEMAKGAGKTCLKVLRPLLCVTRAEIEGYLQEQGLEFCTDSTNTLLDYSRNVIRNTILPVAEERINPGAAKNISVLAAHVAEVERFLDDTAGRLYRDCVNEDGEASVSVKVILPILEKEDRVLQNLVLYKAVCRIAECRKDITSAHITSISELFAKQVGSRVDLPYGITAERGYDCVILYKKKGQLTENGFTEFFCLEQENHEGADCCSLKTEYTIHLPKKYGTLILTLCNINISEAENNEKPLVNLKNVYTKCFDYDTINNTVSLRMPLSGDHITISAAGGTKLLTRYFIDTKVPREQRFGIPVLAAGSDILWVIGGRTGEGFHVTEHTKRILFAEWREYDGE